jgi:hypothetical protein
MDDLKNRISRDEEKYLIEKLSREKIDLKFIQSFIFQNVPKNFIQKIIIPFSSSNSNLLNPTQFAHLINLFQPGISYQSIDLV